MALSILAIIGDVAPVVGLAIPTTVFAATTRAEMEMQTLANSAAKSIATDYDWQALRATATLTGNGSQTAFNLPADYDRMPVQAGLWGSSTNAPFRRVISDDQWLGDQVQNFTGGYGGSWIIQGGQIKVLPAMATGATAKYVYQSNNLMLSVAAAPKQRFTADTDTFVLDDELLRLTMIWMWKAQKGFAYAEDMASAERRKERLIYSDKGARTLASGPSRVPWDASYAYPYNVGP